MSLLLILCVPFCGAFIAYFVGRVNEALRDRIVLALVGVVAAVILFMAPGIKDGSLSLHVPQIMGTGLDLKVGPLQYLMLLLTAALWFICTLFLTQYVPSRQNRNRLHFFLLITLGSVLGFFMSENILNMFTFFEILSLSGYFLIIHDESSEAHEAGNLYLTLAIFGGLCALLGILIAYEATGSLLIDSIGRGLLHQPLERATVGALLFISFAIKGGIYPFHIWLPKAYSHAPTPVAAILTGVLSKTGLYGLYITLSTIVGTDPAFGWAAVILGAVTFCHGGILALLQGNVKRLLAYSSMSQYGLILLGLGAGVLDDPAKGEAISGAFIHMVSHGLFKSLLFLSIGLLYLNYAELELSLIHGIARRNTVLLGALLIGSFCAWGFPGFIGAISKSLLHQGVSHWARTLPHWKAFLTEGVFILGSTLSTAYLIKLGTALLLDPLSSLSEALWMKRQKRAALPMALLAGLIVVGGLISQPLVQLASLHRFPAPFPSAHIPIRLTDALLPVILGTLVHLLITRRKLRSEDQGQVHYPAVADGWPSLEHQLFRPASRKILNVAVYSVSAADTVLARSAAAFTHFSATIDAAWAPCADPTTSSTQDPNPQPQPGSLPSSKPLSQEQSTTTPKLIPNYLHTAQIFLRTLLPAFSGLSFSIYLLGFFLVVLMTLLIK